MQQHDAIDGQKSRTPRIVWIFRLTLYGALGATFLVGGPIARLAAACAAIFAFIGDVDGGIRHTFRAVGLGLAIWLAPGLGTPLGEWLTTRFALPALLGHVGGVAAAGLGIVLGISLFGRILRSATRRRHRLNAADHIFGGLVGAAEGILVMLAVCWTLAAFEEPLRLMRYQLAQGDKASAAPLVWLVEQLDEFNAVARRDPTGQLARRVNPLSDMPMIQTARQMVEVVARPEMLNALVQSRELKEIAALPIVKKHLDAIAGDEELKHALEQRDFVTVMQSPQWAAMLDDRELFDTLTAHAASIRRALQSVSANRAKQVARSAAPGARRPARQVAKQAKSSLRVP